MNTKSFNLFLLLPFHLAQLDGAAAKKTKVPRVETAHSVVHRFVYSNEAACGDMFGSADWLPAGGQNQCYMQCKLGVEICQIASANGANHTRQESLPQSRQKQRCFELPTECQRSLRDLLAGLEAKQPFEPPPGYESDTAAKFSSDGYPPSSRPPRRQSPPDPNHNSSTTTTSTPAVATTAAYGNGSAILQKSIKEVQQRHLHPVSTAEPRVSPLVQAPPFETSDYSALALPTSSLSTLLPPPSFIPFASGTTAESPGQHRSGIVTTTPMPSMPILANPPLHNYGDADPAEMSSRAVTSSPTPSIISSSPSIAHGEMVAQGDSALTNTVADLARSIHSFNTTAAPTTTVALAATPPLGTTNTPLPMGTNPYQYAPQQPTATPHEGYDSVGANGHNEVQIFGPPVNLNLEGNAGAGKPSLVTTVNETRIIDSPNEQALHQQLDLKEQTTRREPWWSWRQVTDQMSRNRPFYAQKEARIHIDKSLRCCQWALDGLCDRSWQRVRRLCPRSCGTVICSASAVDGSLLSCSRAIDVDVIECYEQRRRLRALGALIASEKDGIHLFDPPNTSSTASKFSNSHDGNDVMDGEKHTKYLEALTDTDDGTKRGNVAVEGIASVRAFKIEDEIRDFNRLNRESAIRRVPPTP